MKPTPEQQARAAEISKRCAEVAGVEVEWDGIYRRLLWVSPWFSAGETWDILDPRCFQAFVLGLPGAVLGAAWVDFRRRCPAHLKDPDGECLKWDHSPGGMLALAEAVLEEFNRDQGGYQ